MNRSDQKMTVAALVATRMEALGKTPADIALEIGEVSASVVSMIAKGLSKLPFHLVSKLARALDTDAVYLMRLTMQEYAPGLIDAVEGVLQRPLLSKREAALIKGFRAITSDRDVDGVLVEKDGLLEVVVLGED